MIFITGHNGITECLLPRNYAPYIKRLITSQYENYGLSFPQISQFLICIKIRQEEARVGSGVNIGYVSHTQMA